MGQSLLYYKDCPHLSNTKLQPIRDVSKPKPYFTHFWVYSWRSLQTHLCCLTYSNSALVGKSDECPVDTEYVGIRIRYRDFNLDVLLATIELN